MALLLYHQHNIVVPPCTQSVRLSGVLSPKKHSPIVMCVHDIKASFSTVNAKRESGPIHEECNGNAPLFKNHALIMQSINAKMLTTVNDVVGNDDRRDVCLPECHVSPCRPPSPARQRQACLHKSLNGALNERANRHFMARPHASLMQHRHAWAITCHMCATLTANTRHAVSLKTNERMLITVVNVEDGCDHSRKLISPAIKPNGTGVEDRYNQSRR